MPVESGQDGGQKRKPVRFIAYSRRNKARLILTRKLIMKFMVVDVGESRVKILATGQEALREFASGPSLTAEEIVSGVLDAAGGWKFDLVSIGYPGPVLRDKPASEPLDLGPGRVGFDFKPAFGCLIKLINDVETQALGSYV
jgi:polyphosphate glucokinase